MISDNMKKIFEIGLVPLIVLEDAQDAVPFGQALVRGGIPSYSAGRRRRSSCRQRPA